VQPNTVTINCVLNALAKDNAASHAEALLTRVEKQQYSDSCLDQVCLNAISYTSVIDAYAKSGKRGPAQKAEEIFHQMEQAYKNGNEDAKPNAHSFNAGTLSYVHSL
jgi:pentatricopeptide repeat protein